MANKPLAEWVSNPKNLEKGLFLVALGEMQIPVSNKLCPLCNEMKLITKNISDEQIVKYVKQGRLHGWGKINGPLCVYENVVYHVKCLKKKLGRKFVSPEVIF
jgi:hypothetical protein